MFTTEDGELEEAFESDTTIISKAYVLAEWNLNDAEHIEQIGNYRNRWCTDERLGVVDENWPHKDIETKWDEDDASNAWTNATHCDIDIEGEYDDTSNRLMLFSEEDKRFKYYYSLDDCFSPHRPRSGTNYPLYFVGEKFAGLNSVNSPRYYLAHRDNKFKYWTSFRYVNTDDGFVGVTNGRFGAQTSMGISKPWFNSDVSLNYIHDVAPFVVYKEEVSANKVVVKFQTNIAKDENSSFNLNNGSVPEKWYLEKLNDEDEWERVEVYNYQSTGGKSDYLPEYEGNIDFDGYFELRYGIRWTLDREEYTIPDIYRYVGEYNSPILVPEMGVEGDYLIIRDDSGDKGELYMWLGQYPISDDVNFVPEKIYKWRKVDEWEYAWYHNTDFDNVGLNNITNFANTVPVDQREFDTFKGLRLVVESMRNSATTFDLIELSPRLVADVTDMTINVDTEKTLGAIDENALPIGGLKAGKGKITLFDEFAQFKKDNPYSILNNLLDRDLSFAFYEVVSVGIHNYYVPINKLYSEFKEPQIQNESNINYDLRDGFYMFENIEAPSIMLSDVSLSYAVGTLLDLIGFSNYVFKRNVVDGEFEDEPIIPYFFVKPEQNVAEILQMLSFATQSAMFFDEYNNFVVMYKNFVLGERGDDVLSDVSDEVSTRGEILLSGNPVIKDNKVVQPNIIEVASDETKIYNQGVINYTNRYLQRSIGSLSQANVLNRDQKWIYKPALLWEVAPTDTVRTANEAISQQSAYALGAMPLEKSLSANPPSVNSEGKVINNVMYFGDNIYWLPRYNGYLYANGEIIKFDAMEYAVMDENYQIFNEWISSTREYQKFFGNLPHNGKMYPTGRLRIWVEEEYETQDDGTSKAVGLKQHGRAQFDTEITSHSAGFGPDWQGRTGLSAFSINWKGIFNKDTATAAPQVGQIKRENTIKNFMRDVTESSAANTKLPLSDRGMVRASALSLKGPFFSSSDPAAISHISLSRKHLGGNFRNFGTRMRIIGKMESSSQKQEPGGGFTLPGSYLTDNAVSLTGGSGGIAIGVNDIGEGYYFELVAMGSTNIDETIGPYTENAHNLLFYRVRKGRDGKLYVKKLWGALSEIIVDSGNWVGQQRMAGDESTSVYDISVERKDLVSGSRFYLIINNVQVATVDDRSPLPHRSSLAMFARGGSHIMFENVYALKTASSQNTTGNLINQISDVFGKTIIDTANNQVVKGINTSEFRKFGISGFVQQSYLNGVNSQNSPNYNIYYDEFGTIFRECAHFDVKYDKAYPAFISQISPTLNGLPGFSVSGYEAGPYRAKFLVFNVMDKTISLDETSGNYLRIQGVTFTQDTTHEYKMDEFLNIESGSEATLDRQLEAQSKFVDIKKNRLKYGKVEWTMDSAYIQSEDAATDLMQWLIDKTTRPRKLIGLKIFPNPLIQLGDRVKFKLERDVVPDQSGDEFDIIDENLDFTVYNISYSRGDNGPTMDVYVSEV